MGQKHRSVGGQWGPLQDPGQTSSRVGEPRGRGGGLEGMRRERRRQTVEMLAYHRSLPAERAGRLMVGLMLHALVGLVLRVLLVARLALLARRVRSRRTAGEPLLSAADADWSARALLSAAVLFSIIRRAAVGVLRRRAAEAVRNGTADPAAAAQILADPVARSKPSAGLRRVRN